MDIGQWVSFSVDDAIGCFKWIHENRPESIFGEPMLEQLKQWHEEYSLCCNLYVFEEQDGFSLSQLEDSYWKELSEHSSWLKLGWCGRKRDELSDSEQPDIDSFRRVNALIFSKGGKRLRSKSARLHRRTVSARLVDEMKSKGVNTLFTAPNGKQALPLPRDMEKKFSENGVVYFDGMRYQKTVVCLDLLAERPVSECVEQFTRTISRSVGKTSCVVCVSEKQFHRIRGKAAEFWSGICGAEIDIFPCAAVQAEGKIFLTASASCALFCFDPAENRLSVEKHCPFRSKCLSPFESMVYYGGKIWMIPWQEHKIFVYDIGQKKFEVISTIVEENSKDCAVYRAHAVCDNILWLVPFRYPAVVRIDMRTMEISFLDNFPKGIAFSPDKRNFSCALSYGGRLFLLNDNSSMSVAVDLETGEMEEWKCGNGKKFGCISDGVLYCSPTTDRSCIRAFDIESGKELAQYHLPASVWAEVSFYSFWFARQAGNKIAFLPESARGIALLEKSSGSVSVIDTAGEVDSLSANKSYSAVDMIEIDGGYLFLPQRNNMLIIADESFERIRHCPARIRLSELSNTMFASSSEQTSSAENLLESYLSSLECLSKSRVKERRTDIGAQIYNYLKGEPDV